MLTMHELQDGTFTCRSLYLAAYIMARHGFALAGTNVEKGRVMFLFADCDAVYQAVDEFAGRGEDNLVPVDQFMQYVNQLKDVAKTLTRHRPVTAPRE